MFLMASTRMVRSKDASNFRCSAIPFERLFLVAQNLFSTRACLCELPTQSTQQVAGGRGAKDSKQQLQKSVVTKPDRSHEPECGHVSAFCFQERRAAGTIILPPHGEHTVYSSRDDGCALLKRVRERHVWSVTVSVPGATVRSRILAGKEQSKIARIFKSKLAS